MTKLDTDVRVTADVDVMHWHDPEVEAQRREIDRLAHLTEERATKREKADLAEVKEFYESGDVIPTKELGHSETDREVYLDTLIPKDTAMDDSGLRAVTTPGSRLCYICLRGFPTTDELTAHIGLAHHGRTHWDVERAKAALDYTPDLEPIKRAEVRAWERFSKSADEDRKQRAVAKATDEVVEEAGKLQEDMEEINHLRSIRARRNLGDEDGERKEHQTGDKRLVDMDPIDRREEVTKRTLEQMGPRAIVEETSFHTRADQPFGEPLPEARGRLKSQAMSVAAQEALYEEDLKNVKRVRVEQRKVDSRHEQGYKDVLVRTGEDDLDSSLVAVEEKPGEVLNPHDKVVIKRAKTAMTVPAPRDKEGNVVMRQHPDPLVEERLKMEREAQARSGLGRSPAYGRDYTEHQEVVLKEHMLTSNAGDIEEGGETVEYPDAHPGPISAEDDPNAHGPTVLVTGKNRNRDDKEAREEEDKSEDAEKEARSQARTKAQKTAKSAAKTKAERAKADTAAKAAAKKSSKAAPKGQTVAAKAARKAASTPMTRRRGGSRAASNSTQPLGVPTR